MAAFLTRCLTQAKQVRHFLEASSFVHQSSARVSVYEYDRKGGYRKEKKPPVKEMLKHGFKELKVELGHFKEEVKEKLECDVFMDLQHGDFEYQWRMNSLDVIESWTVTSDMDNSEGQSKASLAFSKNNTALFHGYLSQEVPKDGVQKRSGYCNIRSPSKFKAFKRKVPYDWCPFNCLLIKVRGDGRPYMLSIGMDRSFDINWNDQYNYTLYTRGGPYWQIAKIPFSKFYLTSKGRIQDKQCAIQLEKVSFFGISLGDGAEGPFCLEIDSIALLYDENHSEEFAYEMYQANPAHVGT
ncbi:complex I intermediate-associated protein 30, mitochondrial-like [Gigantopelta aegis]|uniref:complex I intermediate-associated protein 30, mitochondrial-like n=1 Tax=Gigantopelta aegis TaxID=1735272 RepID=UPI001B88C6F7|nr:complex I intermediate-associated protein 30, mitochondrial-like [Gigantopelta aegis]XP_041353255.1 complex I intermediate-associated protein 30, mitochondrial-like [Gigantopelta aegis]XP_041353256.1 complex I intermediate-associated protein 30, mitochondrial-like [Gigantopelta aegis]XP_041353257.1 complex I intermediate-associated protein 30, mitochondrial-like [Gigantopelta aegis]